MVKQISYENNTYKVDDFANNSNKLGTLDTCGDPTFGDDSVIVINKVSAPGDSDNLGSLVIQNYGLKNDSPVTIQVDGVDVKIALATGIEFFRVGDNLAFNTILVNVV